MHRRHRHGAAAPSLTWPQQVAQHAGILDFGLIGGASFNPFQQSWTFARDIHEFVYCRSSPLTQMLPRVRHWEPKPISTKYSYASKRYQSTTNATIAKKLLYMGSELQEYDFSNELLPELIAESDQEDFDLSYYDPFLGNLCATGRFVDLPVIITPEGDRGTDVGITLIARKQLSSSSSFQQHPQPPYRMIRPRSSLMSFLSPICQVATPSTTSRMGPPDEQFLVRTRESVAILAPKKDVPTEIYRVEPDYISKMAQISTRPSNCTDVTIHAAMSPYTPNTYAFMGDRGRIALWTPTILSSGRTFDDLDDYSMVLYDSDDEGEYSTMLTGSTDSSSKVTIIRDADPTFSSDATTQDHDPWQSCTWGAHPSQLITASRKSLDLVDFRVERKATQTYLFTPRIGETIRAIQEDQALQLAPFQTYIATSHQVACIDQRYAKRPLISWAHQMDRFMPCGIKAMDLVSEGKNYSTVLIWSRRNADILAYNISLGSNKTDLGLLSMQGRAQELPSFQSHSQYVNTSSLRDPLKRNNIRERADGAMEHAVKPPLLGLAIIPDHVFDDSEFDEDNDNDVSDSIQKSISKFSLVQYALTGAVYSQDFEIRTKEDIEAENNAVLRDSILENFDTDVHRRVDATSGNELSTGIAFDLMTKVSEVDKEKENEGSKEIPTNEDVIIDRMIATAEAHVAPWRKGVKEAQDLADKVQLTKGDVHAHVDMDLRSFFSKLQEHASVDWDASTNTDSVNIDKKITSAMEIINNSTTPKDIYALLEEIECINLPTFERDVIAQGVMQNINMDPYEATAGGEIIHRQVRKIWPIFGRKVDTLLRDSESNADAIATLLKEMYPFPESVSLELYQDEESREESTLSSRLANMNIPPTNTTNNEHTVHRIVGGNGDDAVQYAEWPSLESRQTRSRTIKRLAQDLTLCSTVVIRTVEPEITSGQKTATTELPTFQYLFQDTTSQPEQSKGPSAVTLSSKCRSVLNEWILGENPAKYVYKLPEEFADSRAAGDDDDGEAMNSDEAREHEERLLKMRRKREKRAQKIKSARMNDLSYNVNALGSSSMPMIGTGIITNPFSASYSHVEADEDGVFSLPTVVSASQLSQSKMRSQQQQKQLSSMKAKPLKGSVSATAPSTTSAEGDSLSLDVFETPSRVDRLAAKSKIKAKSQSQSLSQERNGHLWGNEDSTLTQDGLSFGSSQSMSMSQPALSLPVEKGGSFESLETTDRSAIWGASQPIMGTSSGIKKTKPKDKAMNKSKEGEKLKPKKARMGGF